MKNIGIWIDKAKAHVVIIENGEEHMRTINSQVEDFNVKGGSRSKTRWGPQDVVQDSKYMERKKHQLKRYFDEVYEQVKDADALAIFGPAETYLKLEEAFKNAYKLSDKIKTVQNVDSMTDNQVKALVRDFYKEIQ